MCMYSVTQSMDGDTWIFLNNSSIFNIITSTNIHLINKTQKFILRNKEKISDCFYRMSQCLNKGKGATAQPHSMCFVFSSITSLFERYYCCSSNSSSLRWVTLIPTSKNKPDQMWWIGSNCCEKQFSHLQIKYHTWISHSK